MSTTKLVVIVNAGSGSQSTDALQQQISEGFSASNTAAEIVVVATGDTIAAATQRAIAQGATGIVAAGGDGTINAVAGQLAGTGIPLGVLPAGTLNHFAKDLGIPLEIPDAIATIVNAHTRLVDVSEVNGTVFLNNSSVGLYPRLVQLRAEHGGRGMAKWLVAAWATMRVMRECPTIGVRIDAEGETRLRRTPLVFVGNNEYQMQGFEAGTRESLVGGTLAVYVVRERSGLHLLLLLMRVIRGTALENGQLEMLRVADAVLETKAGQLPVAVDGEVQNMRTPLHYRVRPASLTVFAPMSATAAP